jgi:hypothetical protein
MTMTVSASAIWSWILAQVAKVPLAVQLRDDWVNLIKKTWSVRFALLGSILAAIQLGMEALLQNPPIDTKVFIALYILVSALAGYSRLVTQEGITPASGGGQ